MQHELIAKRYIKPLMESCDQVSLENISTLLNAVSEAYNNDKMKNIMNSGEVSESAKCQLILDMVAPASSSVVNNFVKLLSENRRLTLIPAIAEQLTREISRAKRTYSGRIYSNNVIDQDSVETIARDLGNKMGATISLSYVASDYDGIRVEVDNLNVEINFLKSRLNAQLIEHILKAI
ncbi:F0F1 ATP synthase subunit delta [Sulfuricurvum sp.]|uniref:F0F1 ATP synthase subunit delta n=1 Tax=Sulfuricurvum sp. TaxID=2025608 RepID=UPI0019CDFA92|nr:F0F1 ATP synthase subunit delta [Sulfuricurvum sp.]MBD3798458.1 F0F1 ATP synthase subunit delta [Campylobacterota bacterium]MBD3806650.1 F0F1 ATP synthase subunit delta [Sulfuricurvum sp.]